MKVTTFALLVCLSLFLQANASIERQILSNFESEDTKTVFKVFHTVYKKTYDINSEEAIRRYKIFKSKMAYIKEENSKGHSYTLGITKFMDYTREELDRYLTSGELMEAQWKQIEAAQKKEIDYENFFYTSEDEDEDDANEEEVVLQKSVENKFASFDDDEDSDELKLRGINVNNRQQVVRKPIDWRKNFSAVRDQGMCGSCWAFSTAAALEATYNIKNPTTSKFNFSTQELIDCDKNSSGCEGGWAFGSLYYFAKKTGLVKEDQYPYTSGQEGKTGTCNTQILNNTNIKKFKTTTTSYCQDCTIDRWYTYLSKGPLVISSYITDDWFYYTSGTFSINSCSAPNSNHAVVAVGWGNETDAQGKTSEYTIVRNSWGVSWGEEGYIKIKYQPELTKSCFINMRATLPVW